MDDLSSRILFSGKAVTEADVIFLKINLGFYETLQIIILFNSLLDVRVSLTSFEIEIPLMLKVL